MSQSKERTNVKEVREKYQTVMTQGKERIRKLEKNTKQDNGKKPNSNSCYSRRGTVPESD